MEKKASVAAYMSDPMALRELQYVFAHRRGVEVIGACGLSLGANIQTITSKRVSAEKYCQLCRFQPREKYVAHINFISSLHTRTKRDYLTRTNEYPKAEAAKLARWFRVVY